MVNFILFLRNLARFIEARADAARESAIRKVQVQKAQARKAAEKCQKSLAYDWERECKRHNENLNRIQSNVTAVQNRAKEEQEGLETKAKRLELI